MTPDGGSAPRLDVAEVTLVTAAGCHLCRHAERVLEELGGFHRLRVRRVDVAEAEGRRVVERFRVPFPPVVLVDGTYFGHGRISRRKLEALLQRRGEG